MFKFVLGHVTRSNNVFSWKVSVGDIFASEGRGPFRQSPSFSYKGCSWYIQLFINGAKKFSYAQLHRDEPKGGPDSIDVSFVLGYRWENGESVEDPPILNCKFWRHGADGECYFLRSEHSLNVAGPSMVTFTCRFLEEEDVVQNGNLHDLYSEGNMWKKKFEEAQSTISKLTEEKKSNMKEIENLKKLNKELELDKALSSDFRELLTNGNKTDVVLKVQGKEFPAHRIVLGARSPVFRATFSHDSEEEKTGVVTIPDCDPESFSQFLNFLYSGRVGELTADTARQLYATSDKYDVPTLKPICRDHLKRNLTPESVCDVAALADLHSDDDLASAAQLYFNENYVSILLTREWAATVESNYSVSAKLLKEMESGIRKKLKMSL